MQSKLDQFQLLMAMDVNYPHLSRINRLSCDNESLTMM